MACRHVERDALLTGPRRDDAADDRAHRVDVLGHRGRRPHASSKSPGGGRRPTGRAARCPVRSTRAGRCPAAAAASGGGRAEHGRRRSRRRPRTWPGGVWRRISVSRSRGPTTRVGGERGGTAVATAPATPSGWVCVTRADSAASAAARSDRPRTTRRAAPPASPRRCPTSRSRRTTARPPPACRRRGGRRASARRCRCRSRGRGRSAGGSCRRARPARPGRARRGRATPSTPSRCRPTTTTARRAAAVPARRPGWPAAHRARHRPNSPRDWRGRIRPSIMRVGTTFGLTLTLRQLLWLSTWRGRSRRSRGCRR